MWQTKIPLCLPYPFPPIKITLPHQEEVINRANIVWSGSNSAAVWLTDARFGENINSPMPFKMAMGGETLPLILLWDFSPTQLQGMAINIFCTLS